MDYIDDLNRKILDLLVKHGKVNSETIAEELCVSSSTIRRRLKYLVDNDLLRYVPVPNWEKIGLPVYAVIALDVKLEKTNIILDELSKYDHCRLLIAASGRFNVISTWRFASPAELYVFTQSQIGKLEGITRIEIFLGLNLKKHL